MDQEGAIVETWIQTLSVGCGLWSAGLLQPSWEPQGASAAAFLLSLYFYSFFIKPGLSHRDPKTSFPREV